jgi:hypothetical protein
LIFLVQGIGVSGRLQGQSSAYSSFTQGFSMFTLQLKPPNFVSGVAHRRRLLGDATVKGTTGPVLYTFYEFFSTESPAAEKMSGNFFYSVLVLVGATALQFALIFYLRHKKTPGLLFLFFCLSIFFYFSAMMIENSPWPCFLTSTITLASVVSSVAGVFSFPQPQIKVVLALTIGCLDSSLAVLADETAAPGWKLIAVIELLLFAAFVKWFLGKGKEFSEQMEWRPEPSVQKRKLLRTSRGEVVKWVPLSYTLKLKLFLKTTLGKYDRYHLLKGYSVGSI